MLRTQHRKPPATLATTPFVPEGGVCTPRTIRPLFDVRRSICTETRLIRGSPGAKQRNAKRMAAPGDHKPPGRLARQVEEEVNSGQSWGRAKWVILPMLPWVARHRLQTTERSPQ